MSRWRILYIVLSVVVLAVTISACGTGQQWRDLEGQTQTEPDKVRLVTNVDTYPNVVAICIEGEGFITTTRDDRPIQHVPEWSSSRERGWCKP